MKRSSGGFTLLELMIVLVIAGLFVALASPSVTGLYDSMQYREAVRGLLSAAKNARRTAISQGAPVDLVIDTNQKKYWLTLNSGTGSDDEAPVIDEALALEVTYAAEMSPGRGLAAIRFFPLGGSSGGEISIRRPSGSGTLLRVDWLLGEVRQEPF